MGLSLLLEVFWAIAGLSEFSPRGAEMEKNVVAFWLTRFSRRTGRKEATAID